MKHRRQDFGELLDRSFARLRELPPSAVDPAWENVLRRLREDSEVPEIPPEEALASVGRVPGKTWPYGVTFAVAATVVLAIFTARHVRNSPAAPGVVVEGSLYGAAGETKTAMLGETVRSNDEHGTMLALADGSSIEMRTDSEIALEHADDGMRIRLLKGGVIVNAAKQRAGRHLYVQTKDVSVSVVGTVFLVNAEEEGSRVAVFEGEVRVRQGATEKKLLPGQQVKTSSKMEALPVQTEIAWSRRADEHLSLLKQASVALQVKGQNSAESRRAFEVVSIKPHAPGNGGRGSVLPSGFTPACYGDPQVDPARFSIHNTTVYQLIALAYGERCERWEQQQSNSDSLSGGPRWIREDRFDIDATIPPETPNYTAGQLSRGHAPEIQAMLQSMLADRFKLVLEHSMKEMHVYTLTVAKGGFKVSPPQDGNTRWLIRTLRMGMDGQVRPSGVSGGGTGGSMERLASSLSNFLGRPVLDRTGITYDFSFSVDFALPDEDCSSCPTVAGALQDKLGLKLENTKASVEVLVVGHVEKPSDN